MSGFYFGPLGGMVPLVVAAGVQVETARASSEFVSSGGVRYVQRGRAAPRTWNVSRQWQEPEWARMLDLAAHGLIGESWLYDVAGARENMIPAYMTAGTGGTVKVAGISLGAVSQTQLVRVPVLAGRLYTLSAWADYPVNTRVASYQINSDPVLPVGTPPGAGDRYSAASFTVPTDSIVSIRATQDRVSGLRLHDGPPDQAFYAGHGTPCRVAVSDPGKVLQMVRETAFSDYDVTLQEVGKAGFV